MDPAIRPDPGRGFDVLGAVLTTLGVGSLAFALIEAQDRGWGSALVVGALVVAVVALAVFVLYELRRDDPLVDVRLFRIPAFTAANVAGLAVFFAFIGAIVYFSAYFQDVQGRSAVDAGLRVLPIGVALALTASVSGRLTGGIGARTPMLVGLLTCAAATLGLLRLQPDSGLGAEWWDFAARRPGRGAGPHADDRDGGRRGAPRAGGHGLGRAQLDAPGRAGARGGRARRAGVRRLRRLGASAGSARPLRAPTSTACTTRCGSAGWRCWRQPPSSRCWCRASASDD